jgi:hypothetical protein
MTWQMSWQTLKKKSLHDLADELADLEKKVPRELKEGADGMKFDDPKWLGSLLDQVRPMLLQRLIHTLSD